MSCLSDLRWAWTWHEVMIFNSKLSTLHIQRVKMWISQHQQVLRYVLASSKTLNTKHHFQLEFKKADSEKPERETFCRHLTLSVLLGFFFSPWKFHIWCLTLLCKMALSWSNRNPVCATADLFWRQSWLQEAGVFAGVSFLIYFRRIRRNLSFKRGHLWSEY